MRTPGNRRRRSGSAWRSPFARAAALSGGVLGVALLTRGGSPRPRVARLQSGLQVLALAGSLPAVVLHRALRLASGDYLSNRDLALVTALNLTCWTGIFAVSEGLPKGEGRPRRVAAGRRRTLLTRSAALGGGLLALVAARREKEQLEVVPRELPLVGLPTPLDGLRVAVVSDLHRGPFNSLDYLVRAMRHVARLSVDLVLATGDFVHTSGDFFEDAAEALSLGAPRLGLLGTLGNHDHWQGTERARAVLPRSGLRLLDNDRLFLTPERELVVEPPAAGLCVAGVGDLWEDAPDLARALRGTPSTMPRLLMSHNPDFAEDPAPPGARVDLQVSGHTHGGQVNLLGLGAPFVPSRYGNRYARGLVRGPRWPVYVNRGLGTTVLPLRLGARPEITVFTLRAGRS